MRVFRFSLIATLLIHSLAFAGQKWMQPAPHGTAALATANGKVATVALNSVALNPKKYKNNEIEFNLSDGTVVGGLRFCRSNPAPLIIASFGFLADRWAAPPAQFVRNIIDTNGVDAHVLILDHPTSAPYYARNGNLSYGGYDEGRHLVEIAEDLRQNRLCKGTTTIHLLGVSMGGNGVIQALAESERRGEELFASVVSFSAAVDLAEIPATLLAELKNESAWGQKSGGFNNFLQAFGIKVLFKHFRDIYYLNTGERLPIAGGQISDFLYSQFSARVTQIQENKPADFSKNVDVSNFKAYMASNDLKKIIPAIHGKLLIVHAKDDPSVPFKQFQELRKQNAEKPNVVFVGTPHGGHWGFMATYGRGWVGGLIRDALTK